MFITQSPEEIRQSLTFNANASIVAIRLAEARVWGISPEDLAPEMTVETGTRFHAAARRRIGETVTFAVDFRFAARRSENGAKPQDLFKVYCKLEAQYSIKPDFEPTEEQLKAFHGGNVIFNCWPFLREFVQSTAARMRLPPPPIPLLRLTPPTKKAVSRRPTEPVAAQK